MPKKLSRLTTILALSLPLAGLFSFAPAFASHDPNCVHVGVGINQGTTPGQSAGDPRVVCGKDGQGLLKNYFGRIFNWGVALISTLAVLVIIVGGYRYMTSGGSPDKIEGAKNMITGAIGGLLLVIFAWVILKAINPGGDFG